MQSMYRREMHYWLQVTSYRLQVTGFSCNLEPATCNSDLLGMVHFKNEPHLSYDFSIISIIALNSSTAASSVPVKPVTLKRILPFLSSMNLVGMPEMPKSSTTLLEPSSSFRSIST